VNAAAGARRERRAERLRVIRLEGDVNHTVAKPRTIADALDELEGKVGKDVEKFLRSMGEELDDEDDVIDVESK
jgi:hypothetical protein